MCFDVLRVLYPWTRHTGARPSTAPAADTSATVTTHLGTVTGMVSQSIPPERTLTPADLKCGARIPVFGKWLLVRRCDRWTRKWYKKVSRLLRVWGGVALFDPGW